MTEGDQVGRPAHTSAGMPDFVVIGAQKSASTFLQDQLAQHPAIEIAEGEVRYFEDPFYSPEAVATLPELFSSPVGSTLRGIKRPDYLGHPEVPARLHEYLPDARLLVVIREPVARAVSAYYHYVRHGFAPLMPLDEAFEALVAGTLTARYPRSAEVLDYGLYGKHLSRYLEHYPVEQLKVFEQKTLTAQPEPSLRSAFEFLGVDTSFVPDTTSYVSNKGVYSPFRLRLLRTKNRFVYDYSADLRLRRPRKPSPLGWAYNAAVVGLDRTVLSRFDDGRPPALSARARAQLEEFYAQDRQALEPILAQQGVTAPWLSRSA
ncbi:sulfotransferase family protein [Nocardioides caldifontis]|uniref:sulfotransferase family protein n=1 Tax=Nocardioides caldifontis TaxID=2588938 RepID=UPI0011E005D0|nr:sulfotransferase [Nocardioides caldifontis]